MRNLYSASLISIPLAFSKLSKQSKSRVRASYEVALLLAKRKRPFTDGEEIVKPVLHIAGKMLGDKTVLEKFKDIPLSNDSVRRRTEELSNNVKTQITRQAQHCQFFALAMDESNDVSDTAQVTIFIRAVNDDFDVVEELLGLKSLGGTTKGTDLFDALKSCVEDNNLDWAKLHSICTDGAPAMTGRYAGCLSLLEAFLMRPVLKYHCIIHQEALCGKVLDLKHVMSVVLKCVNRIRARALSRREFRQFLNDINQECGEPLMHCEVRWLSRGKVLARFWDLKDHILQFLTEIDDLCNERKCLEEDEWLNDLAFLVDISEHLNSLNLNLQGMNKLFTNMCNEVASFESKLKLFIGQLAQRKLDNFCHLKERAAVSNLDTDKYTAKVEMLLETFQSKFAEFHSEQDNVLLFSNPFTFPEARISSLDVGLQLEVIDVRCNTILKGRFYEMPAVPSAMDMISFWRLISPDRCPNLHTFALQYICRFGSTYRCEQTFSAMKLIKNRNRSCLTDHHLCDLLTLATSNLQPDIDKLVGSLQAQKSH